MRTLAIGDVHGCLTALETLLGVVRLKSDDHLIMLGDYVDRGPDTRGVLDRVIRQRLTGQAETIRGKLELMMVAAGQDQTSQRFWLQCGGREAIESYALPGRPATLRDVPPDHWHFLTQNCIDWYETDTHIFVHACVRHDLPMERQETRHLQWDNLDPAAFKPHFSGKTMVCGHTEQRGGLPLVIPGAVGIDTWAYAGGWLTCLCVETGEYWQANEQGEARHGKI